MYDKVTMPVWALDILIGVLVAALVLILAFILVAFAVCHEDTSFQLIGAGFSLSEREKLIHHKKKVEILVDKRVRL